MGTAYTNGSSSYTNGSTTFTNGSTSYTNGSTSYTNGSTAYNNDSTSYANGYTNGSTSHTNGYDTNIDDTATRSTKKGSWRKEMEAYEEKLTKTKTTSASTRTVEPVKDEEPVKVRPWQKSTTTEVTAPAKPFSSTSLHLYNIFQVIC